MATKITVTQGTNGKSSFKCRQAGVPVAVVSRIQKAVQGKTDPFVIRTFLQKLSKYGSFLDALELEGLSPIEALTLMGELKPSKPKKAGSRPKSTKTEQAVARLIAQQSPASRSVEDALSELVAKLTDGEFAATVERFRKDLIKANGIGADGYVRLRPSRTMTPGEKKAAIERLSKARAKRGTKKK